MTPELEQKLVEKYPLIFVDHGKSEMLTCMHWGLAVGDGWYNIIDTMCGTIQQHIDWSIKSAQITEEHNAIVLAVRAGNLEPFDKHFSKMAESYRDHVLNEMRDLGTTDKSWGYGLRTVVPVVPQFVATQVKEKFAGLRFYHDGGDKFCSGVTSMAEAISFRTCEQCGVPGKVGGKGWIKTLCEEHRKEIQHE